MTLRSDLQKKTAEAKGRLGNENVLAAFEQCKYLMGQAASHGDTSCPLEDLGGRSMTDFETGQLVSMLASEENNIDVDFDKDMRATLRWN